MGRRLARRVLVTLVLGLVGWLGSSVVAIWLLTDRSAAPFDEPPIEAAGVRGESCRLRTSDGLRLGAWLWSGRPDEPIVVLLHGHRGSRSSMFEPIRLLASLGLGVLAVSLRAHGDSDGDTEDFGWSGRKDLVAAVDLLERRFPGRRIGTIGVSLGAATALFAAGELEKRVSGYWLESPYMDLESATRNRVAMSLPPLLDDVAYSGMRLWAPAFLPTPLESISPLVAARAIPPDIPVYFWPGIAMNT